MQEDNRGCRRKREDVRGYKRIKMVNFRMQEDRIL
jgi:hypothetical protein